MRFRFVPKSVTLNDLERRNDPYLALFHLMFIYYVVVKQLLRVPRYQNLLLIFCDHINTICAIITGSIARSANLPVFSLLRGRF